VTIIELLIGASARRRPRSEGCVALGRADDPARAHDAAIGASPARRQLAHGRALVDRHAAALDGVRETDEQLRRMDASDVRREGRHSRGADTHARVELIACQLANVALVEPVRVQLAHVLAHARDLRGVERDLQVAAGDEVRVDPLALEHLPDLAHRREHLALERDVRRAPAAALRTGATAPRRSRSPSRRCAPTRRSRPARPRARRSAATVARA